jgi:hypothetical protein
MVGLSVYTLPTLNYLNRRIPMYNFDKYKNTLPHPRKSEFTTQYFYRKGELILKFEGVQPLELDVDVKGCVKEVVVDEVGYKNAITSYNSNGRVLLELFKTDLAEYLGLTDHNKFDKLFDMAWERRHSDGYCAIAEEAEELAELLY